jgi:hypothetical protein
MIHLVDHLHFKTLLKIFEVVITNFIKSSNPIFNVHYILQCLHLDIRLDLIHNIHGSVIYSVFTKEWCGLKNLLNDYILQLDGAPPHSHRNVRELLNRVLQQRWIGRAANGDNHIHILYGTNSIIMWMCAV